MWGAYKTLILREITEEHWISCWQSYSLSSVRCLDHIKETLNLCSTCWLLILSSQSISLCFDLPLLDSLQLPLLSSGKGVQLQRYYVGGGLNAQGMFKSRTAICPSSPKNPKELIHKEGKYPVLLAGPWPLAPRVHTIADAWDPKVLIPQLESKTLNHPLEASWHKRLKY